MKRHAGFPLARNVCCAAAMILLAADASVAHAQTPGLQKSEIGTGLDPMPRPAMVYRVVEGIPRLTESAAEPSMTTWIGEAGQLSARRHLVTGLLIGAGVGALAGTVAAGAGGGCNDCMVSPLIAIPIFAIGGAIVGTIVGGVVYKVRSRRQ